MTNKSSGASIAMEEKLQTLNRESIRYKTLFAAKSFKDVWVVLAEHLTEVRHQSSWREWGYSTFKAYCWRELHIREETANKLTRSFGFIQNNEPQILQERESREVPRLDVVDLLSRAKDRTTIPEQELSSISHDILNNGQNPTKHKILKRFREIDPHAFKTKSQQKEFSGPADLKKALILAERLYTVLSGYDSFDKNSVDNIKQIIDVIKNQFETSDEQQSESNLDNRVA